MPREKFQTLTEQMFYILLCLQSECYGMDIMEKVRVMTDERVSVGPGTLYNLLESFVKAGMICETKVEGRRRSYLITDLGMQALEMEYQRLMKLTVDYWQYVINEGGIPDESDKA
jgi:DNA-binding PadR family transcriptional regulator